MHDDPHFMAGPRLDEGTISPSGKLVRFHGGKPKTPAPSKQQSLLSSQAEKELLKSLLASNKPMEVPELAPPPPAPVPSPPPTMSNADVMAAKKLAKKEASQRKGIKSTLLMAPYAKDMAKSTASMTNTLLG